MTDAEPQPDEPIEEKTAESVSQETSGSAAAGKSMPGSGTETETAPLTTPEFPDMKTTVGKVGSPGELNRLYDVQVTVAAELGRTSVPIQELLGLTEGSVFELDRNISSPIELVAQGIPLGNGEVVVVDDSFAIRIKEIYANPSSPSG